MDKAELNKPVESSRNWRAILGEIKSHDDLLTKQGQELYAIPRERLPPAVQRWQAAFGLCLWLGNGWSDIAWQHLCDLAAGVEGLSECGFELGLRSGQEVLEVFRTHGLDPASVSFEEDFHKISEAVSSEIEAAIAAIDDRSMQAIWDELATLNDLLIRRAAKLASSPE